MKKLKRNFSLVIVLLLFVSVESDSEEGISKHDEKGAVKGNENSELSGKGQGTKSGDSECPCIDSEEKNDNSKFEKIEPVSLNIVNKNQFSNPEDNKEAQPVAEPKQNNENANECNQQSGNQDAKSEELKLKDSVNPEVAVDDSKLPKTTKEDDKNQKINLSDVNSQVEDNDHAKSKKRETYSDSPSYALGLPRDASYFFDDLEPFINNNSDIGRIGRAAPSRDKNQKSKLKEKGRDIMDDDLDEDEEEEKNEEDEKQDEDDYDEDEDVDSDCKPTTACPRTTTTPKCTTTCPTTRCPTTTTTCPTTTTKCTTKHRCPTTCKTTTKCTTTKCPRVCDNGGPKIQMGARVTTEGSIKWDADKKKLSYKKRKVHSKVASTTE